MPVLKVRAMRRTKKEFLDYNEYRDRPFGLKWGTAFAMEELVTGIKKNEAWAVKEIRPLEQMSREEMDSVLLEAFLYHKKVSLQLNTKDEFGRYLESIEGFFTGEAYHDYFILEEQTVHWCDVRHVQIKQEDKWFDVSYFPQSVTQHEMLSNRSLNEEIVPIKDEFYQSFPEEE